MKVDRRRILETALEVLNEVGVDALSTRAIAERTHMLRPLGIGYSNLGSLLMRMGLPYDSDEGRAVAASVTSPTGRPPSSTTTAAPWARLWVRATASDTESSGVRVTVSSVTRPSRLPITGAAFSPVPLALASSWPS